MTTNPCMPKDEFPYNRTQIKKVVSVLAVGVPIVDNKSFQKSMPILKKFLRQKIFFNDRFFIDEASTKRKLLLVDLENLSTDEELDIFLNKIHSQNILYLSPTNSIEKLKEMNQTLLEKRAVTLSDITKPGPYRIILNYENLNFDEVLKLLLPEKVLPISSFSVMGHLVHFNLNEDALPFKEIIGHVALDKIPNVKTIVSKANSIDTQFRTFQLDLLAGEENYVTCTKENEITFHFDFSKVYWNSRLGTEHSRIVQEVHNFILKNGHYRPVIFDACCGIGPFVIPLAKLKHVNRVYANDLNPESVYWLKKNIEANSSKKRPIVNMEVFNLDARDFLRQMILEEALKYDQRNNENGQKTLFYIIMNLPATAIEFFDVFTNIAKEILDVNRHFYLEHDFIIRCYTFVKTNSENPDTLKDKVVQIMGMEKSNVDNFIKSFDTQLVRNVAPFKDMYRINVTLNLLNLKESIEQIQCDVDTPPVVKKLKKNIC